MQAQHLVDEAVKRTGLSEFGVDTWREGFEVLLRSIRADAALNAAGEQAVGEQIVGVLVNRLEIEDWFRRHPEIEEQEIIAPLFGLGLPRTGSTALGFLMSLDPARRSLRAWEGERPCPPPETASEHSDPRIAATQARLDIQHRMFPEFSSMLPSSATGPTECMTLLALDFRSLIFAGMAQVAEYSEWVIENDMEAGYRYHRRVLQLLQWRCPPRAWWLRTPSHVHGIDELNRVYPDARFVMTHRDIASVIPSAVDLVSSLSGPLTTEPERLTSYMARHYAELWDTALHRLIRFRDAGAEHRFFDIGFRQMQAEPIAAIRALYEWLGETLSDEAKTRMAAWWAGNAEERHGVRQRDPAEFDVDPDQLRRRFRFYSDRFPQSGA